MSAYRGARRRTAVLTSLTALAFLAPSAVAHAEPTVDDVQEEIEQLEEDYIELNAVYNEAQENHETAEEKLEDVHEDIEIAEEQVETLGIGVRELANSAYTGVDLDSPAHLIGASGPEQAQEHQADLAFLSEKQNEGLDQYVEELEHLETLETEAVETEEEAAEALEEAEEATEDAEASITEQEETLAELSAEERAEATENVSNSGGETSGGGSYTGPASGNARVALDFAYDQIGKPYVWGGTGPGGYDCSGLTQAAWGAAGVSLPRTTYDQVNTGSRVSWENKQPGDLLFFYGDNPGHVGMYAGDGVMVHASTAEKPIGTVTLNDYYRSNFSAGVRP